MTDPRDDRLEAELYDLGARLSVPSPPDVTDAVLARLATRSPRRRFPLRSVAIALVTVLAVGLAVSPQAQAAVAQLLRFAGIELDRGGPPTTATRSPRPLLPGEVRVDLAEARRRADFPVGVPADLGTPDEVLLVDAAAGGRPRLVSLLYHAGPGRPAPARDGVAVRLDEFAGRTDEAYFRKQLGDVPIEEVTVGGNRGLWLVGAHPVFYVDRHGTYHEESARLAGNTLIWQVGDVTYRLEGAFDRDEAIAIGESVR